MFFHTYTRVQGKGSKGLKIRIKKDKNKDKKLLLVRSNAEFARRVIQCWYLYCAYWEQQAQKMQMQRLILSLTTVQQDLVTFANQKY